MGRIIWERTDDGLKPFASLPANAGAILTMEPYHDGLLVKTESGRYFVNQKGKVVNFDGYRMG